MQWKSYNWRIKMQYAMGEIEIHNIAKLEEKQQCNQEESAKCKM